MDQLEGVTIRLLGNPHPEAVQPDFVEDAYVGLVLSPTDYIQPGEDSYYPQGAYMVPIPDFMRALAAHNHRAYEWFAVQYGPVREIAETRNWPLKFPFATQYCVLGAVN